MEADGLGESTPPRSWAKFGTGQPDMLWEKNDDFLDHCTSGETCRRGTRRFTLFAQREHQKFKCCSAHSTCTKNGPAEVDLWFPTTDDLCGQLEHLSAWRMLTKRAHPPSGHRQAYSVLREGAACREGAAAVPAAVVKGRQCPSHWQGRAGNRAGRGRGQGPR